MPFLSRLKSILIFLCHNHFCVFAVYSSLFVVSIAYRIKNNFKKEKNKRFLLKLVIIRVVFFRIVKFPKLESNFTHQKNESFDDIAPLKTISVT